MKAYKRGLLMALLAAGIVTYAAAPILADGLEVGKKVYKAKRCSMCHRIDGKGGKMGPDLSGIGALKDREWIGDFLRDPKGTQPGSKHKIVKAGEDDFNALVDYMISLKKEE